MTERPKRPAIQFYKGDYLRSEAASCSIGAQGLWIRMLFVMDDADECGYLIRNGKALPDAAVARLCGVSTLEYMELLPELEEAGVAKRDDRGIIYSRRMVRDEKTRQGTAVRVKRFRNADGNEDVTASVTPLYEEEEEREEEVVVALEVKEPIVAVCEMIYNAYPRKVGRPEALKQIREAIKRRVKSHGVSEEDSAQFIHQAVLEYARSPSARDKQYVPHPERWFKKNRFDDDRADWYRDGNHGTNQSNGNGGSSKAQQRADRINGTAGEALALLGASGAARPVLPDGVRRGAAGDGHKNLIELPGGRGEKSD
jgi:hypothetical protein